MCKAILTLRFTYILRIISGARSIRVFVPGHIFYGGFGFRHGRHILILMWKVQLKFTVTTQDSLRGRHVLQEPHDRCSRVNITPVSCAAVFGFGSARRPDILAEDLRGFPKSLQKSDRVITLNYATTGSFHVLYSSLIIVSIVAYRQSCRQHR
jgi:hypothetical protein